MKILIYKRTHNGDPSDDGIFGDKDCMGRIRNWNFDAVIGIGGNAPWKESFNIRHKINWIGLEPKKIASGNSNWRGNKVVFGHFALFKEDGIDIKDHYPNLFDYMYGSGKRFDMSPNLPEKVFKEVTQILASIKDKPASIAYNLEDDFIFENRNERISKCNDCFENGEVEVSVCEC